MDLKEKIENWKSQAESLRLQLYLGKKEAENAYEEKKKELSKWLEDVKEDIDELQDDTNENLKEIKAKAESLRVQMALGKADSLDTFKENQEKINSGFQGFKYELEKAIDNGEDKLKGWAENAEHKIDQYHTRFDLFKLQLSLAKMEGEDKMEEKRKEVSSKISEFKKSIENLENKGDDKWGNFKKEISSAWGHVKKAF